MADSTCTIDGCMTAPYAKGMCRLHYRRTRPRTPDQRETVRCDACGADFDRPKRTTQRWVGTYCSYLCRDYTRHGGPLSTTLPSDHWARMYGATCPWEPPVTKAPPFRAGTCQDCGAPYVERAYSVPSRWCSEACARRVGRRKRKAREHDAPGTFRYIDVMRQYQRQGFMCAYCKQPCAGLPDPEHVIPISRGGRNDMSNIVAACRACNGDKRDLTPSEWAIDRARRGLAPLDTSLNGKAFLHLDLTLSIGRVA